MPRVQTVLANNYKMVEHVNNMYFVKQQMDTIHQNHNNVLICQLLHFSSPHRPIVRQCTVAQNNRLTFYHLQYVAELS